MTNLLNITDENELQVGLVEAIGVLVNPPPGNRNNIMREKNDYVLAATGNPLFLGCMQRIIQNENLEDFQRQTACILLRNFIRNSWGGAPLNDKNEFRNILIPLITSSIPAAFSRTLCYVLNDIVHLDFPHNWPNLMTTLMQSFNEYVRDEDTVKKAMIVSRCILNVTEQFSDVEATNHLPLIKRFLSIAGKLEGHSNPTLRSYCVKIVGNIISPLVIFFDEDREEDGTKLFRSVSDSIISFVTEFISKKVEDGKELEFKSSVLGLCVVMISNFSEQMTPQEFERIIQAQIKCLEVEYRFYFSTYLAPDACLDDLSSRNEFGEFTSLKRTMVVLFESLVSSFTSVSAVSLINPNLQESLFEKLFPYVQITAPETSYIFRYPCEYLEKDLDISTSSTTNVRAMAVFLMKEVLESFEFGNEILWKLFKREWIRSVEMHEKDPEGSRWMNIRDASLNILQSVLIDRNCIIPNDDEDEGEDEGEEDNQDSIHLFDEVFNTILSVDLPSSHNFLHIQAMNVVRNCMSKLSPDQAQKFFQWGFSKFSDMSERSSDFVLRVLAGKALVKFMAKESLFPSDFFDSEVVSKTLTNFIHILSIGEKSISFISIECIRSVLKFALKRDQNLSSVIDEDVGKRIITILYQTYEKTVEFLDIEETKSAFIPLTKCRVFLVHMIDTVLPSVIPKLSDDDPEIVSKCIEMVNVILTGYTITKVDVKEKIFKTTFFSILGQLLTSQDPQILGNCTDYLKNLIRTIPKFLLTEKVTWRNQIGHNFDNLTVFEIITKHVLIGRILQPDEHLEVIEVGNLISAMFENYFGGNDEPVIVELVESGIRKIVAISMKQPFRLNLINSFIRLFSQKNEKKSLLMIDTLSKIRLQNFNTDDDHFRTKEGQVSALEILLVFWSKNCLYYSGYLDRRFCCVALEHLLTSPKLLEKVGGILIPIESPMNNTSGFKLRRGGLMNDGVLKYVPFKIRSFMIFLESLEYEITIRRKKDGEEESEIIKSLQDALNNAPKKALLRKKLLKDEELDDLDVEDEKDMAFDEELDGNNEDMPLFDALIPFEDEDEDSDDSDLFFDRFDRESPMFGMDLAVYLAELILKLSESDESYVRECLKDGILQKKRKAMMEGLLKFGKEID